MEIDLALLGILAAIAFFAGFIHSAIGFGFGIVAISLLPFFNFVLSQFFHFLISKLRNLESLYVVAQSTEPAEV